MGRRRVGACAILFVLFSSVLYGMQEPVLQDPDHFRWTPPDPFPSAQEWQARAKTLRLKLLLSAGLWPERERTPLHPRIFDIREGKGFRVAKVYFESLPGFLATGNLYLPTVGTPPYPAILSPHGHWQYGRLQNGDAGSIPGRCIDFARQGYVVFAIDMVGYNDSFQLPHDGTKSRAQLAGDTPLPYEPRLFRSDFTFPEEELYGFSLGGLQLWNGIRALDFLTSIPEVDPTRIGVTGASGGATQTILLMATDDRVRVAAPVNIIGTEKHPGCACENLPGLWIGTSTIEMAATFAPRPLLLVSADRDPWTNSTPSRELPILKKYYALMNAGDRLENAHLKGEHNYNAQSRAAVYAFFRKYLNPPGPPVDVPPPVAAEMKELGDLRVFPDFILPQAAKSGREIAAEWQKSSVAALARAFPKDATGLESFRAVFGEALALTLNLGNSRAEEPVDMESLRPAGRTSRAVLIVVPESFGRLGAGGNLAGALPWIRPLVDRGNAVYRLRGYASGKLRIPDRAWNSLSWPGSYNRSNELRAIQEIMTAMATIRRELPDVPLTVIGLEKSGFLTAFGASIEGGAERILVDLNGEDPGYDQTCRRLLPVGSIRRVGDLKTAALLAGGRMHLFNAGPGFDQDWYRGKAELHGNAAFTDADFLKLAIAP